MTCARVATPGARSLKRLEGVVHLHDLWRLELF